MPGPDSFIGALVAYSPGPGLELIPYFVGLVTWAGLAFAAIFLSPVAAFLRRMRRNWRGDPADAQKNSAIEAAPKSPAEGPRENGMQ